MLGTVALVLYGVIAPIAYLCAGRGGLWASALAGLACLAGAEIALVISHLLRAPGRVLWGLLFGMAARMGIPLTFGLVASLIDGPLARAGLLFYLLVFFPVTLAVETVLSLPQPEPDGGCKKTS